MLKQLMTPKEYEDRYNEIITAIDSINSDPYLSPREASSMLGISSEGLAQLERSGKIKAGKTKGKHRRYLLSEINKYRDRIKRKKG